VKRTVAAAALVVFCLALLAFFRSRAAQDSPESVVHRMVDAARRGAVRDYLACFGGALRRQLEGARKDAGDGAFGRDLRSRYAEVTGVATTRGTVEGPADGESGEILLRMETVYRDRNEVQEVRLRRMFGGWRIVATGPARGVVMPIKYGTPVVPPPEARAGN